MEESIACGAARDPLPFGVKLAVVLQLAGGGVFLGGGALALGSAVPSAGVEYLAWGPQQVAGVVNLTVGILCLASAPSLAMRHRWAWNLALTACLIGLSVSVAFIQLDSYANLLSIAVCLAAVYCLMMPDVKTHKAFRRETPKTTSPILTNLTIFRRCAFRSGRRTKARRPSA